jgi:hypothetical protein
MLQNASTVLKMGALLIICCGALISFVMDNGDKYYNFSHPWANTTRSASEGAYALYQGKCYNLQF